MRGRTPSRTFLTTLTAVILLACPIMGGDLYKSNSQVVETAALPKPVEIRSLTIFPDKIDLIGGDDAQQLIVTALLGGGVVQDLTGDVKYEVADSKIARVTTLGRVVPLQNGITEVTATFADRKVKIPVKADKVGENLPINFANQIVPVFTKLGCNAGGCHGKASGQNGFKLSLLGFEPDVDFTALVKEARGRRVFPGAPDQSLLLLKATGAMAHAGGKRTEIGSDEYRLMRRWIAAGMPYGKKEDPVVTKITVVPDHRVLQRRGKQQFAVYAHYSDETQEDITRRAQYDSNDTEIAIVDGSGLVSTTEMSGEAAIMARYQGFVSAFRATVPRGNHTPDYKFPVQTVVDQYTSKKWRELGLVPSEPATDEQFIRRASLDITGTLPSPKAIQAFLKDKSPGKRDALVDALLETPEYSYYFTNKWADILRVKRRQLPDRAQGTFAFHNWLRQAIANDMPYNDMAREILAASGSEVDSPPTVWYKELQNPEQFVDDTAQVFLGLRLACAQCHHHPYEKWSQDDYWGLAAFFGRVGRKNVPFPGGFQNQALQVQTIYNRASGSVTNKRTGKTALIKPLDAKPIEVPPDEDPRQKLVDWMVDPSNPFFARAVANRYWAHFFTRGIVEPLDDMRVTNPPSNPELLEALAQDLIHNNFSLKHLIQTICKSRTYQLGPVPNKFNQHDKQTYARYYPKRMSAEVLFDAVCQVTNSPTRFGGMPQDTYAPRRAIMLPDESFSSYFLDVFGRPQRISACECERVNEANLAQALHLLNSDEIQGKISQAGGRADLLSKDARTDGDKVEELFVWAYARKPTKGQLDAALTHLKQNAANKRVAFENIIWALLNTKEFAFNE